MVRFRLRVARIWTAQFEDLDGRLFLHTRRAQLLRALVHALGLNVLGWGETFADYPREEVTLEVEAASDEVFEEAVDQLARWVQTQQLLDAQVTKGNEPEVSVTSIGKPRTARGMPPILGALPGGAVPPVGEPVGATGDGGGAHRYRALPDPVKPVARNGGGEHRYAAAPDFGEPVAANGGGGEGGDAGPDVGAPVAANGGGGARAEPPERPLMWDRNGDEDEEAEPPSKPSRFTVVHVFETATEALAPTRELSSEEPLQVAAWYALDISIDVQAGGIKAEDAPRPIEEPKEEGDATIAVLASSADFDIDEPVRTLTLPPSGRSRDHAVFKIRAAAAPAGQPGEVRIQLLYRLNLIEDIVFVARLVPAGAAAPADGSLLIRHAPIQQLTGLDELPPKQMHLHVSRRDEQYLFYFVVEVEQQRLAFNGRAPSRLTEEALSSLLSDARNALLRIALTHKTRDDADPPGALGTDPTYARELATAGRRLWMALFGNLDASLHDVGKWLEGRHFDEGAVIQVTVDDAAGTFVFPWGLLYDRRPPKSIVAEVEIDAFWGLRYVIEQHIPPIRHRDVVEADFIASPRTKIDASSGLNAAVMLGHFLESRAQETYFESLRKAGVLTLDGGHATRKAEEGFASLEKGESDIYSFFTHGHTERPRSEARTGVSVDDFLKLVSALPKDSIDPNWQAVQEKIEAQKLDDDETWIELASGRITRPDLDEIDSGFHRAAVVLLNMCESVQLTPTLTSGLVDKFMELQAMAVVGTETSVPPRFAHHFGLELLTAFLGGAQLGTALLAARRRYAEKSDLFGLAYTLYGSGRVTVEPPIDSVLLKQAVEAATAAIPISPGGDI
jgi:hypothetical protein